MAYPGHPRCCRLIVATPSVREQGPRLQLTHARAEMSVLDSMPWAAALAGVSYGVRLGIRSHDPSLIDLVRPCLPPHWTPILGRRARVDRLLSFCETSGGGRTRVYADAEIIADAASVGHLPHIVSIFAKVTVADLAPHHLFVHAGALEYSGKAILLPGQSGTGKTSMTAALVRAGATYYSDDYAVLDGWGRVHPYAQPLGIREPGKTEHNSSLPEQLGGRAGSAPVAVGLVVFTGYSPGAAWEPRPLPRGEAFARLFGSCRGLARKPERGLASLERALRHASIITSPRGDADVTAPLILDFMTSKVGRNEP